MTIEKAKETLAYNVLDLSVSGLDYLPMKLIQLYIFDVVNRQDEEVKFYDRASLLATAVIRDAQISSCSFFVEHNDIYYYRDFLTDAMGVIEALRTINGYKNPSNEESFTITL